MFQRRIVRRKKEEMKNKNKKKKAENAGRKRLWRIPKEKNERLNFHENPACPDHMAGVSINRKRQAKN